MRMLMSVALGGVILLSGCATVDQLEQSDPVYYGTTSKSPQDYAACVAQSWRQQGLNVTLQPIGNGVNVVVTGGSNVEQVLRAQTYHETTQVNMYTRTQYHYQPLAQSANLCAG